MSIFCKECGKRIHRSEVRDLILEGEPTFTYECSKCSTSDDINLVCPRCGAPIISTTRGFIFKKPQYVCSECSYIKEYPDFKGAPSQEDINNTDGASLNNMCLGCQSSCQECEGNAEYPD